VSGAEPEILSGIAAYYASKLAAHGSTPQGVDWNGIESHERRHRQFLRLLDGKANASVIDLGCGFGDFLRFLRAEGYLGRFTGYDIAPAMIEKARELHGETDDRQWQAASSMSEATSPTISGHATSTAPSNFSRVPASTALPSTC
jgi:SAM-dependent methyltransferase